VTEFLQHTVNGSIVGSIYVLIALGVTLVYGLTRLINFAHGEVVSIGALTTFWLVDHGTNYYLAVILAGLAGGIIGAFLDRGVFRFTRSQPINGFLVSLGLIACSQALLMKITQDNPKSITSPIDGSLNIAGVIVTWQRVFVVAIAAALFIVLLLYLKLTRFGRATRAYSENPDAAAMMGIDGRRVVFNIFVIGSAQASVAGALVVSLYAATPTLGGAMIIKAFAVALIGGLGSVVGALIAGLGVGLAESYGAAYVSSTWTDAFGYLLMLVVLMIRPTGLARGGAGAHL
jgi:branched-chain amino acid transport system permease protein